MKSGTKKFEFPFEFPLNNSKASYQQVTGKLKSPGNTGEKSNW